MSIIDPVVLSEYRRLQAVFPKQVLGLLEIGSRANGESVDFSDRDFRLVIRTDEPFRLLQEHAWITPVEADLSLVERAEINMVEGISFGITNLGYIEHSLAAGQFPLGDHTALYQGRISIDEVGGIHAFHDQHAGVIFDNVIEGYILQTDWRVSNRLEKEADRGTIRTGLDRNKQAVPMVHTCCRILRDIAQIDTYRHQGVYVLGFAALEEYYREKWPKIYPWFRSLFALKTDSSQRKLLFLQIDGNDEHWLTILQGYKKYVTSHWANFRREIKE